MKLPIKAPRPEGEAGSCICRTVGGHEPKMTEASPLPGGQVNGPFPIQYLERSGQVVYACRHCGLLYSVKKPKDVPDGR